MLSNRLKFRVWDNRENKYVKSDDETQFLILETGNLVRFEKDRMTVHINTPSPYTLKLCGSNYVVEQCTGINDKNRNLIYEGDFIKYLKYQNLLKSYKKTLTNLKVLD